MCLGGIFCLFCLFVLAEAGCVTSYTAEHFSSGTQQWFIGDTSIASFPCLYVAQAFWCNFAYLIVLPLLYKFVTYVTIINTHFLSFLLIHISYIFGVVLEIGNFHFISSYRMCAESVFLSCATYRYTCSLLFYHFILKHLRLEQSKRLLL